MPANGTNLLSVTRAILTFAFYVILLCIPAVLVIHFFGGDVSDAMAGNWADLPAEKKIVVARVLTAKQVVNLSLALPIVWLLRAIVDSARSGDPFVPENAARLRRIGWLVVAANVAHILASPALPPTLQDQTAGYPGLVTILLVFVLARIFETGTRMRTEIQETV